MVDCHAKCVISHHIVSPAAPLADVCLVYVLAFSRRVQRRLHEHQHQHQQQQQLRVQQGEGKGVQHCAEPWWVDMTDPASGYPVTSPRGLALYPDVDGAAHLLGYETVQVQCCRILHHPRWGGHNYPATLFTTAPLAVVKAVLSECLDGAMVDGA